MIRRFPRLLLTTVVLATPTVVTSALTAIIFGATIFDFVPSASDETFYWHQTLIVSRVGLAGGYYTYEELPPPSGNSVRFGFHGPAFPVLYGLAGRALGWEPYSAILFNLALITVALAVFIRLVKPDNRQLLVVLLLVITFWPLWLYLPSNMQETLQQAFAIVMAAIFYRLLSGPAPSRLFRSASCGFIVLASLVKPTWSLLAVPFFCLAVGDRTWRRLAAALTKAATLIVTMYAVFSYWSSPYPYYDFVGRLAQALRLSPVQGARLFVGHAYGNTLALFQSEQHGIDVLVVFQVLFLVAVMIALLTTRIKRRQAMAEPLFHLFNIGSILAFVVLFYAARVGYRPFAVHLLISLLLLIAHRRFRLMALIVAGNALLVGGFLGFYREWRTPSFNYDRARLVLARNALQSLITYDSSQNAWCNTALSAASPFAYEELIALPPGIGYSVTLDSHLLRLPLKSKYILLNAGSKLPQADLHLQWLGTTPVGIVYRNLDAPCR